MKPEACELLIRGGTVIDGTGAARRVADVAVDGDRIAAVGQLDGVRAGREIDASGLVVAPGFVDAHTHDDRAVLSDPGMACKVSQGVTTVVTGNCGVSLAPLHGRAPPPPLNLLGGGDWYRFPTFAAYREELEGSPPALNVAMQVGHTALRAQVMDGLDRAATEREIERMVELADEGMRAGCIGFSTGLAYPPARAAPTEEVIAIAHRVAAHGGMHSTHMRDEEGGVLDSIRETVRIGREAGLGVVISHHKCAGRANWGGPETPSPSSPKRRRPSPSISTYTPTSPGRRCSSWRSWRARRKCWCPGPSRIPRLRGVPSTRSRTNGDAGSRRRSPDCSPPVASTS